MSADRGELGRLGLIGVAALGATAIGALGVAAAQVQMPTTGEELYAIGCAKCHGLDGRGVDLDLVAFDLPLPDFSDCWFASREPTDDWFAVAHRGGPVRGFDRTMPAFGGSFSDEQISLVIDHIRTMCTDDRWPRGELNLPRALVTEKAYPEDEAVWTIGVDVEGDGRVVNEVLYEKRFGPASMFEIALPFGIAEQPGPDRGWEVGLADIAVGVKHTLWHDLDRGGILAIGGEVILPTGSAGLGVDATRFEPYLAFGQILPGGAFAQLQSGLEISTDTEQLQHEAFWRLALGRTWTQGRFGRSWTPMVEILGDVGLEGPGRVQWAVVPQLQLSLNTRQHVLLNIGARVPVTDTERRSTQIVVYLLWDWFDGGLLDGW